MDRFPCISETQLRFVCTMPSSPSSMVLWFFWFHILLFPHLQYLIYYCFWRSIYSLIDQKQKYKRSIFWDLWMSENTASENSFSMFAILPCYTEHVRLTTITKYEKQGCFNDKYFSLCWLQVPAEVTNVASFWLEFTYDCLLTGVETEVGEGGGESRSSVSRV